MSSELTPNSLTALSLSLPFPESFSFSSKPDSVDFKLLLNASFWGSCTFELNSGFFGGRTGGLSPSVIVHRDRISSVVPRCVMVNFGASSNALGAGANRGGVEVVDDDDDMNKFSSYVTARGVPSLVPITGMVNLGDIGVLSLVCTGVTLGDKLSALFRAS